MKTKTLKKIENQIYKEEILKRERERILKLIDEMRDVFKSWKGRDKLKARIIGEENK